MYKLIVLLVAGYYFLLPHMEPKSPDGLAGAALWTGAGALEDVFDSSTFKASSSFQLLELSALVTASRANPISIIRATLASMSAAVSGLGGNGGGGGETDPFEDGGPEIGCPITAIAGY